MLLVMQYSQSNIPKNTIAKVLKRTNFTRKDRNFIIDCFYYQEINGIHFEQLLNPIHIKDKNK